MSYITKFNQNIVADTNNSSVVALNAGLWFAGVATSTLGVAAIQVSLKTDQNSTIYVDQSPGISAGVGTATITGTNTLNGTLTKFTRDLKIGDVIIFDPTGTPQTLTILAIASDTEATCSTASNVAVAKAFNQYYWDITDVYNYFASINNTGFTIQAINSYLRVRVLNYSTVNQTYLRLQTVLCPIVEAVPRSLNEEGDLKTAIYGIEDGYGFEVENTPIGEMRTIIPNRLVGAAFDGSTLDPNFWTAVAVSGGTATQLGANVTLATNTTANGAISLNSVRRARYVSANSLGYRSVVRLGDTGTANNKRRWGVAQIANYTLTISSATVVAGDVYTNNGQQFTILVSATGTSILVNGTGNPGAGAQTYTRIVGTGPASLTGSAFATSAVPTDGAWFQLDGTTFSIVTSKGGSETTVSTGSFNGIKGATWTPGIVAMTYEIYWTNSRIYFVIGDQILHTVISSSATWSNTVSFYIFNDNVNSSGSVSAVNMYIRVASIRRLGPLLTQPVSKFQAGTTAGLILKYSPGNLHSVIISSAVSGSVITLYDATSASGNIIWSGTLTFGNQGGTGIYTMDFKGLPFHNGLTLVIATQNSNVLVVYE